MSATQNRPAVLFPGQGSQEKGMGRALAESKAEAMALFTMAEKASGLPLREIYWDGDETAMADTRNLQPAMTAVTLGLWFHLRSKLCPMGLAGHSLGEYAALAASGMLDVDAAFELTSLRGRLMAEADGSAGAAGAAGKMAAVLKLSLDQVEAVVKQAAEATGKILLVANYNSPGQYVLSGQAAAVEAAAALVKELKGRAVPLAVSGAFHSPLMAEAAAELEKVMRKRGLKAGTVPVYFNVTGEPEPDPGKALDLLARQMTSQVRWIGTLAALWRDGARRYVELGPKGVLTKLLKANFEGQTEPYEGISIAEPAQAEALGA